MGEITHETIKGAHYWYFHVVFPGPKPGIVRLIDNIYPAILDLEPCCQPIQRHPDVFGRKKKKKKRNGKEKEKGK